MSLKIKYLFDFVLALIILVITLPITLITYCVVMIFIGSPVFFVQARPGLNEKIFNIFKFRTMTNKTDAEGNLLEDHLRLTPVGKFIRKLSLDELPQLLNVLRGELSLVGPRPLLVKYLERYNQHQKKRHLVKPGITGWAQINGRNALTWEQKFELDIWYVENWSLLLDLKIIAITAIKVFKREGISAEGHETMTEFLGTKGKKGK